MTIMPMPIFIPSSGGPASPQEAAVLLLILASLSACIFGGLLVRAFRVYVLKHKLSIFEGWVDYAMYGFVAWLAGLGIAAIVAAIQVWM